MATIQSPLLLSNNADDPGFRAWTKFISDVFALAWTDTAAAGEINFTTVVRPATTSTSAGFKVYRMNDALQATKPVFVKIEFGTGAGATTATAIWITIGTGHDGAGTITNILFARTLISTGANSGVVHANSFGSADTNRVCFALWLNAANVPIWFSLERTKDLTGADTGEGLLVAYGWPGAHKSRFLPFIGAAPPLAVGLFVLLTDQLGSANAGDVGVSAAYFMNGPPQPPGINIVVGKVNDFGLFAVPSFELYGVAHVYQHCGAQLGGVQNGGGGLVDINTRLFLRYE